MKQHFKQVPVCAAIGLLALTHGAYAAVPASQSDVTRTRTFTYDSNARVLDTTYLANDLDNCTLVQTRYSTQGVIESVTSKNCLGAPGTSFFQPISDSLVYPSDATTFKSDSGATVNLMGASFGLTGVQQTKSSGGLTRVTSEKRDLRFGGKREITAADGTAIFNEFDDFGRLRKSTSADGVQTLYRYCALDSSYASADSIDCSSLSNLVTGADEAVSFTEVEVLSSNGQQVAPRTRKYFDADGAVVLELTQAFDGPGQPVGARSDWVALRHFYYDEGPLSHTLGPYYLSTGSFEASGNAPPPVIHYKYDRIGRVTGTWRSDNSAGAQGVEIDLPGVGRRRGVWVTKTYTGQYESIKDSLGQVHVSHFNVQGQIARSVDPTGAAVAYKYGAFGRLTEIKDPLGNERTFKLDFANNVVESNDPNTGLTKTGRNPLGAITFIESPVDRSLGTRSTYTYDALGRLVKTEDRDQTITFGFDKKADGTPCYVGRLCFVSSTTGFMRTMTYDSLGRVTSERQTFPSRGLTMGARVEYDDASRVISATYPTGVSVGYSYTPRGFSDKAIVEQSITGVTAAPNESVYSLHVRNAMGQVTSLKEGASLQNLQQSYQSDNGRLRGLNNGTVALKFDYDALARPVKLTDSIGDGANSVTDVIGYDAANRITSVRTSSTGLPSPYFRDTFFTYNAVGLPLSNSDIGTYTYGSNGLAKPYVPTNVGGRTFSSDANGNLTTASSGAWRSISYNALNLPSSSVGIAGPLNTPRYTFQYGDGGGRISMKRVEGSTTKETLYFTSSLPAIGSFEVEYSSSGVASRHMLGGSGNSRATLSAPVSPVNLQAAQAYPSKLVSVGSGKIEYTVLDISGSVRGVSGYSGNPVQRYAYEPFGKRRQLNGGRDAGSTIKTAWSMTSLNSYNRGFGSHEEYDDVGFVHMNGRLYDDSMALFMQPDPSLKFVGSATSYGAFNYGMSSPFMYTDPSGFESDSGSGYSLCNPPPPGVTPSIVVTGIFQGPHGPNGGSSQGVSRSSIGASRRGAGAAGTPGQGAPNPSPGNFSNVNPTAFSAAIDGFVGDPSRLNKSVVDAYNFGLAVRAMTEVVLGIPADTNSATEIAQAVAINAIAGGAAGVAMKSAVKAFTPGRFGTFSSAGAATSSATGTAKGTAGGLSNGPTPSKSGNPFGDGYDHLLPKNMDDAAKRALYPGYPGVPGLVNGLEAAETFGYGIPGLLTPSEHKALAKFSLEHKVTIFASRDTGPHAARAPSLGAPKGKDGGVPYTPVEVKMWLDSHMMDTIGPQRIHTLLDQLGPKGTSVARDMPKAADFTDTVQFGKDKKVGIHVMQSFGR